MQDGIDSPLRLFFAPCGARYGNYGDWLSPRLIADITGGPVLQSPASDADLVAIGSIADQLPPTYRGAVWGTGLIRGDQVIHTPLATLCAVRGKLSASRWPGAAGCALGDPGLLRTRPAVSPRWALGLVPHYVDFDNAGLYEFATREEGVTVIDLCRPIREVEERIASCEMILSSSLHGLVCADAFGIPNRWMVLSTKVEGGGFKFQDYYSIFHPRDVVPYGFDVQSTVSDVQGAIEAIWWARPLDVIRRDLLAVFPKEFSRAD